MADIASVKSEITGIKDEVAGIKGRIENGQTKK